MRNAHVHNTHAFPHTDTHHIIQTYMSPCSSSDAIHERSHALQTDSYYNTIYKPTFPVML